MKTASAELITLLTTSRQFVLADLYAFTLLSGTILRYAAADVDIIFGGYTYSGRGPLFTRGRTRVVIGVEVDTLDLTVAADDTHLVGSVPFLQAVLAGALDGAQVTLSRVFAGDWGVTPAGAVVLFSGRVAESTVSRTEARLTVRSDLEILNTQMPRNLYQPGCGNTLFDAGCGLVKSAFAVNSAVAAGSTLVLINCALAEASGWYDLGTVTFTGGPNAGVSRSVKKYLPGALTLSYPLPKQPTVGDTFTAYPGCDKQQATCASAKFNNLTRFRGFPYIPEPEAAL